MGYFSKYYNTINTYRNYHSGSEESIMTIILLETALRSKRFEIFPTFSILKYFTFIILTTLMD